MLTDGRGVPLATSVTAAHVNDHLALAALLEARLVVAPARLPQPGLCLDAGYDYARTEAVLAAAGYTGHIRHKGEARPARDARVEPRRWLVERLHAWHNRYRRLLIRWEKNVANWLALIHFAHALITYRACSW